MAKLGSPQTVKFSIGTAELRIGPLTAAMKLTQAESIGLLDNANVEVTQESVDLEGGFPKVLVDTAVVKQTAQLTATLREYSRRNLQVLLGEGVVDVASEPADVSTTLDDAAAADAVIVPVADETGFVAGQLAVCFSDADPSQVTIARVESVAAGAITLDSDTPLLHNMVSGDHIFVANQVAIGNIQETNYFSAQLMQLERATGRPVGFAFWKASIGAGMNFQTNAEDFASTEMQLKLLQPASDDYTTVTDPLYHLRDIIPTHPTGIYIGGGDN